MKNSLILTKQAENARSIQACFDQNHHIKIAADKKSCFVLYAQKKYDYLFIDLSFLKTMGDHTDYKRELKNFWQIYPDTDIIVLTKSQAIRDAVEAVKAGASDYLTLPLNKDDITHVINRIEDRIKLLSELNYLRDAFWSNEGQYLLRTNSPAVRELLANLRSVARTESTVLILGETGTGKGVLARFIHQYSNRNFNQFISVHCGAIPDTLLESELFGHEKGAFTGAVRKKLGKFEIAHGGTIFLDEIGTISAAMQIKLLQVLQDKTFYRVGGESEIKSDVRILTATNANLAELKDQGLFRPDLYYRLNVFQLEVPPLRDRLEDLALLVEHILKKLNRVHTKSIHDVHPEVMRALMEYKWPGNIRELENLLERAYILENSSILTPRSFPIKLFKEKLKKYIQPVDTSRTLMEVRQQEIERIEREYLEELLIRYKGKINLTAQAAGIGNRQIHKLMVKYGLQKEDYKRKKKSNISES
jgi:DNA-binding NtrC family response regulator